MHTHTERKDENTYTVNILCLFTVYIAIKQRAVSYRKVCDIGKESVHVRERLKTRMQVRSHLCLKFCIAIKQSSTVSYNGVCYIGKEPVHV